MAPEFSYGLSASLVGNSESGMNVGLKSLQVAGNSLMPLLAFYGQSIVDRFPTHAEQFNQNVNSQAMNSANLARESLDVFEHFMAVMLYCAVQAVELRSKLLVFCIHRKNNGEQKNDVWINRWSVMLDVIQRRAQFLTVPADFQLHTTSTWPMLTSSACL